MGQNIDRNIEKKKIAYVIWDLDDTIYLRRDSILRAMAKTFPQVTQAHKEDEVWQERAADLYLLHNQHFFELNTAGEISVEQMHICRITETMRDLGLEITPQQALQFQEAYKWDQYHLQLSDVMRECLRCLKEKGIFMGMITNGLSDHQRAKYQALGLDEFIPEQQVMVSGDVGIKKPDPQILHMAEQKWNLDPEATVFVGDSYANDMACAKAARWQRIWLKLSTEDEEKEIQEEGMIIVHSQRELLKAILSNETTEKITENITK